MMTDNFVPPEYREGGSDYQRPIGLNPFFLEQWAAGHYKDTAPLLFDPQTLTSLHLDWDLVRPGYRSGVLRLSVPSDGWRTSVVPVTKDSLFKTSMECRVKGETPRLTTRVLVDEFAPAQLVEVVLYRKDVLAENNEPASGALWDVITILTHPTPEPAPMNVGTLMANHFNQDGGTATKMSSTEFELALRESHAYWKNYGIGEIHVRGFRDVSMWGILNKKGINVKVLTDAYDWTIDVKGELHGLIGGDQGYTGTGIRLNEVDTLIWNKGLTQYLHQDEILEDL